MSGDNEITRLLRDIKSDRKEALEKLLPLVYAEMRKIADSYMRRQVGSHTLQPTALLNEAYLRLVGSDHPEYRDRTHFYAVTATIMRNILVDHARARKAQKRGGGQTLLPLNEQVAGASDRTDLIALDDALKTLARIDERKARVIELRIFAGLTVEEVAEVLEISVATVGREARFAEAWLRRELVGS